MGRSTDSFDDMRKTITLVMQNTVLRKHEEYKNGFKSTSNGFEIVFDKLLKSKEDAENLTLLIDSLMLMYIEQSAKYKNR